jgi:hypothetical protein
MKHLVLGSPLRGLSTSHVPASLPSPPHSLLDYPPLATLTNVIIQAFNDLRQCAPLAGGPEISQELNRLLESTVHDIVEYHRQAMGLREWVETSVCYICMGLSINNLLTLIKSLNLYPVSNPMSSCC